MAKWFVEMYQSVPVWVEVEADTAEQAGDVGEELIRNGMGQFTESNVAYYPDRTVYTEGWELPEQEVTPFVEDLF